MNVRRVLAGALLIAGAALANSSCSTTVSDTSTGGGEDAPPKTWCSYKYGDISTSTDAAGSHDVSSCTAGEVCAHNGFDTFECCDPDKEQYCAYSARDPGHDGHDHNLYCAPGGWERLPIVKGDPAFGDGRVCTEKEICAVRTGDCIKHVCCDPKEDPKCGVPGATCT